MADYNSDRRLESVKKLCTEFKQLKNSMTKEHIAKLWQDVHDSIFKRTQTHHDERCLKEVVTTLLDTIADETLESPTPVVLEKWFVLRSCLGHLLRMWPKFNIDIDAFNTITNAFNLIPKTKSLAIPKENMETIELILLDDYFVSGIITLIHEIKKTETNSLGNSSNGNKSSEVS